jgi:hypothetical protein
LAGFTVLVVGPRLYTLKLKENQTKPTFSTGSYESRSKRLILLLLLTGLTFRDGDSR